MAVPALRQTTTLRELLGLAATQPRACPMLDRFAGPALWLDSEGALAGQNLDGALLLDPYGGLETGIAALAGNARGERAPQMAQIGLPPDLNGGARAFDVAAIPQEDGVLVFARDASAAVRNVQMLKASRAMFRDIVMCVGGFAFETSGKGVFTWVGPGGTLGHRQEDLLGRPARELLADPSDLDPFASQELLSGVLIWLRSAAGGPRAMRMSVKPVLDRTGQWMGVRGHAQDVTDELRALRRERVSAAIVDAGLNQSGAYAALSAVAGAVADACGVEAAWIVSQCAEVPCARSGSAPACEMTQEVAARVMTENVEAPVLFSSGPWSGLAIALRSRRVVTGALVIANPTASGHLGHDVVDLLRDIAPMVSLVTAQAHVTAVAETASRRDPLTRLLNKAAFLEDANADLALAGATRAPLAVMIACAQFKAISDGLGAAACDELILEISKMFKDVAGPGGLCARLGPGDFAIWMSHAAPGAEESVAAQIAQGFRNVARRMSMALAVTPEIVAARPEGQTAEALLQRAVTSLAAARKGPRGRSVMQKC
jgi:diguanylate cyclase (GGDEF)-like protein